MVHPKPKGGAILIVHKVVLLAKMDYFRACLSGKFAESQTIVAELHDTDKDDLQTYINMCYMTHTQQTGGRIGGRRRSAIFAGSERGNITSAG